jgi:hypothetical protein
LRVSALRGEEGTATESYYDRARNFAGILKGLPKDLAENPKYMEDSGSERRSGDSGYGSVNYVRVMETR